MLPLDHLQRHPDIAKDRHAHIVNADLKIPNSLMASKHFAMPQI